MKRYFEYVNEVIINIILWIFVISSANAMSVSPVILDITSTGNGNKGQITVLNDGAKTIPVEIAITRLELDENGGVSSQQAGDEFLIFPPQALVPAGSTQTFRVQWIGSNEIKTSQTYNFSVNQVPVKMPDGKSGVQVVFNFGCIVNVSPVTGQSGLNLIKTALDKDEKGKIRPYITVKNGGNILAKFTDATVVLSGGAWSQTLTPEYLRQSMGIGLVQPGKTRRFLIPVDLPAGVASVAASINYKHKK